MSTFPLAPPALTPDPRAVAASRLKLRARRKRRIRRTIVLGAVIAFQAIWLVIFLVLVSGHDPALSRYAAATTHTQVAQSTTAINAAAAAQQAANTASSQSSSSSGSQSGGSSSASSPAQPAPSSVSSRQS